MLNKILYIVDRVLNDIVWWKWYEIEFIMVWYHKKQINRVIENNIEHFSLY